MINKKTLRLNYPIINTNKQGQKIYNPDFAKHFDTLKSENYLDLAQKLAQEHSTLFRHIYLEQTPKQYIDIMQDGALSCAVFVSQVLLYFGLLKRSNATVSSLENNLSKNGRKKVEFNQNKDSIKIIPKGSVLIRANQIKKEPDKTQDFFVADYHIGLYSGNNKAISNVVTNISTNTNIKAIAEHNAIRDAPKLDHYDKIEIVRYYILNN